MILKKKIGADGKDQLSCKVWTGNEPVVPSIGIF